MSVDDLHWVINPERELLACSEAEWNRFASVNDGQQLIPFPEGSDLLDFFAGTEVRELAAALIDHVLRSPGPPVKIPFRCDAPEFTRTAVLKVSPIVCAGAALGILFASQIVNEMPRRRSAGCLKAPAAGRRDWSWPVMEYCSYCGKVRSLMLGPDWMEIEDYYGNGGGDDVRLDQTICGLCADSIRDRIAA